MVRLMQYAVKQTWTEAPSTGGVPSGPVMVPLMVTPTATSCVTCGAGFQFPSPVWSAAIVQVPAAVRTRLPVDASTEQTEEVFEL